MVIRHGRAKLDFLCGEWLRDEFAAGNVEPAARAHADLAIVLAQAREASQTLRGDPAAKTLPVVTREQLGQAMTHEIQDLKADIDTDTANVLLTLARIGYTLTTGRFVPKDQAAEWLIRRDPSNDWPALAKARDVYIGAQEDEWSALLEQAKIEADRIVRGIGLAGYNRG
jgi:streptomycin 3"-adenylyltransferase